MEDTIYKCFAVIGVLIVTNYILGFLTGIYNRCLRGGKNLRKHYGTWAVVTGATDGIGKAMAFEFAKKEMNIVLISRSKDKLDTCADEIKSKNPKIEVRVLAVDFSKFDESVREMVNKFLLELDIGVLVNNVGISYPYTKYFHELTNENVDQLITLNVNSTTWMTRIVLPGMLSRKRGAIVNIGSGNGIPI